MKLGTETGSVTNHALSRGVIGQPDPAVGMGATLLSWTDRHAGTIVSVEGGLIGVQRDASVRVDSNGMSESQEYKFSRAPNAPISYFRKDKKEMWQEVRFNAETKRWKFARGYGLRIGRRDEYHDFSF